MKETFGKPFKGIAPRLAPKLLPPGFGQEAQDAKLFSGDLEAFAARSFIRNLSPGGVVKTLYLYEGVYWLNWAEVVRVAPPPIANDARKRLFWTGEGDYPRKGDEDGITNFGDAGGDLPYSSYKMGVKAPTVAPTEGTSVLNDATTTLQDVAYVHTFVSAWGEESAPSPPLVLEDVDTGHWQGSGGNLVQLDFSETDPGSPYNMTGGTRRIYRTSTGRVGIGNLYLLVAEVAITVMTYDDTVRAVDLGQELPSHRFEGGLTITWDEPPDGLEGLVALAGGFYAGFVGNALYLSEPYYPHAWPSAYVRAVDYDIQGLIAIDDALYVVTKGFPYLFTGVHPVQMNKSRYPSHFPGSSSRGYAETLAGALFGSTDGLVLLGPGRAAVITRDTMGKGDWEAYEPSSHHFHIHDGKLFLFYETVSGITGGLIFDPTSKDVAYIPLDLEASAGFVSPEKDTLYLVQSGAVWEWEGDAVAKRPFDWRSGPRVTRPTNFGAAAVRADYSVIPTAAELEAYAAAQAVIQAANDAIPVGRGSMNGFMLNGRALNGNGYQSLPVVPSNLLEFHYYADGVLKHSETVSTEEPFRLPGGFEAREHEVRLVGDLSVNEILLGTTRAELE